MNAPNTLEYGFNLALKSFYSLLEHKLLVFFIFVPRIIITLLDLLVFNVLASQTTPQISFFELIQGGIIALSQQGNWYYYSIMLLYYFFQITLLLFFHIGLIYQTNRLLDGNGFRLKETLSAVTQKWRLILLWALITAFQLYIVTTSTESLPVQLLMAMLNFVWLFFIFFVLPLIALSDKSLIQILIESFKKSARHALLLFGGFAFFIGLSLLMLPIALIMTIPNYLLTMVIFSLLFLARIVISTIYIIFQTRAYRATRPRDPAFDYLKQPTP